jgi:hypothetical protein
MGEDRSLKPDLVLQAWPSRVAGYGRRFDELVYELYGLTDEEMRIVEGLEQPAS